MKRFIPLKTIQLYSFIKHAIGKIKISQFDEKNYFKWKA